MTKDEAITLEALKYAASMGHRLIGNFGPFTIKSTLAQPAQEPDLCKEGACSCCWTEPAQEPTSSDYALGYAEGFNDACKKPAQEPVAWEQFYPDIGKPQLAQPPQRPWVGLTDEEIERGRNSFCIDRQAFESSVWWAEAKLKEKNT